MVGWHHRLNGHEFEQAPRDGEEQSSLACSSPRGSKESEMTQRLHNNLNTNANYWILLLAKTTYIPPPLYLDSFEQSTDMFIRN